MGYQVVHKKEIAQDVFLMTIHAPLIAKAAKAGQFVVVRSDVYSERIPLTIMDTDTDKGQIEMVVQIAGTGTAKICAIDQGDDILDIAGPLGRPSELTEKKKTLVIGGGVGIAAIVPIVKALRERQNTITVVLGARSERFMILDDRIKPLVDRLILTTDDGSLGLRGKVTDAMDLLHKEKAVFDQVWTVGPTVMMKYVSLKAKSMGLPIWASLNPVMIDGTGMCGGCRIEVDGNTRYACVDGPEFEGSQVDWDNLLLRQMQFADQEKESFHRCRLAKKAE